VRTARGDIIDPEHRKKLRIDTRPTCTTGDIEAGTGVPFMIYGDRPETFPLPVAAAREMGKMNHIA